MSLTSGFGSDKARHSRFEMSGEVEPVSRSAQARCIDRLSADLEPEYFSWYWSPNFKSPFWGIQPLLWPHSGPAGASVYPMLHFVG